jgi:hypothetical protein
MTTAVGVLSLVLSSSSPCLWVSLVLLALGLVLLARA